MMYKFFYTSHCPRCPQVKKYLEQRKDIEGSWIAADTDEGLNEARKHQIMQVPTVIFFENNGEIGRAGTIAEIESFAG